MAGAMAIAVIAVIAVMAGKMPAAADRPSDISTILRVDFQVTICSLMVVLGSPAPLWPGSLSWLG
jgi:hypothetical protein